MSWEPATDGELMDSGDDDDDTTSEGDEDSTHGTSMSEDDDEGEEIRRCMEQLMAGEVAIFSDPFRMTHTMHMRVYSASYTYPVLRASSPLNVEYIMDLFDHPLNDTSPSGSDIVDACHLHYTDTNGVHMVHRDGYIGETGFLYAESLPRLQALQSTLRDSPFLASVEIDFKHRFCMDVTLHGQTNFPIDMIALASDTDIQCSEVEPLYITFRFGDDVDDTNHTVVRIYANGQASILIEGRDASEPDTVMLVIDRVWTLLCEHCLVAVDNEMDGNRKFIFNLTRDYTHYM